MHENYYVEEIPTADSFLQLLDASTKEISHLGLTTIPQGQKLRPLCASGRNARASILPMPIDRFMGYGKGYDDGCNGARNVHILRNAQDFQTTILGKRQSSQGSTSCSISYNPPRLEC